MSVNFQAPLRDVLVETADALRLGVATKRFQDWLNNVMTALNAISNATQYGTATPAPTSPGTDGSPGTAVTISRSDHTHRSPGGLVATIAPSVAISTVETQVIGATIPGGLLAVGTVLQVKAFATVSATTNSNVTFRLRIGSVTLTGNIPASLTCKPGNAGTVTDASLVLDLMLTVRADGAVGACYGFGTAISLSSGATVTQALALANELFVPAEVAVDTTVANLIELTCSTVAATVSLVFESVVITVVKL